MLPTENKSKSLIATQPRCQRWITITVWAARIIVGAVFLLSGFVKGVDPWGSIIKIEEYLTVWHITMPRTITVLGAMVLAFGEWCIGGLLLLGCYRRAIVWLATAFMSVMTLLTLYIWIYNPVSDCGCFGDFIILSNGGTFAKNIVLDLLLVPLLMYNNRVRGVYSPYTQWMVGAVLTLFIAVIGMMGYNVQPIFDFRRFPVGTSLVTRSDSNDNADEPVYNFVYERDGKRETFSEDNIPDSTWTFVDREIVSGRETISDDFSIIEDGVDITSDIIDTEGDEILVIVPDVMRANPSHTYVINEIDRRLSGLGISLVTLLGPGERGVEWWQDMSMTSSPIYIVEPTLLKELVRGNISLVYLHDGVIMWKRTLSSVALEDIEHSIKNYSEYPGKKPLILAGALIAALVIILTIDLTGITLNWLIHRRRRSEARDKTEIKE